MVLCIIAALVFIVLSLFSARYRPLAKEAVRCVFRTVTFKPCDTGLDDRLKAEIVSQTFVFSPMVARFVNKQFTLISWVFVIISLLSFAYMIYGGYNFYVYGNCDGPTSTGACILNTITGDYGRFSEPKQLVPPTTLDGISAGNSSAKTVVIEFGCFTCPYTQAAESTVEHLLAKYNNSIYYVFKPFPLPTHADSYDVARSVLCARNQGKQWEMRKLVFANQTACATQGNVAIHDIAVSAGLDMKQFDTCFNNHETDAELNKYIQEGNDSHIYATPTFFVNGTPFVGIEDLDKMSKAVEASG